MCSSKKSPKSQILILRYSQTKEKMSFVFYCFCYPSTDYIFGINWSISNEFSAKCSFLNGTYSYMEK